MTDYYVRLVELPIRVEGVTVPNSDGSFSMYINSLLSSERRDAALQHELEHIQREHFYLEMPVACMEQQANGKLLNIVLHPPAGKIACFPSEDALAAYVTRLARQCGREL